MSEQTKTTDSLICEVCKNSYSCTVELGESCPYEIADKEELLKRMVSSKKVNEINNFIIEKLKKEYNCSDFEMYSAYITYDNCPYCDGSGITLDAMQITKCDNCGGAGVVDYKVKEGFHIEYAAYFRFINNDQDRTVIIGIGESEEEVKKQVEQYKNNQIKRKYLVYPTSLNFGELQPDELGVSYGKIIISDMLRGIDFGLRDIDFGTGVLKRGTKLVLLDTEDHKNEVLAIGDWMELHEFLSDQLAWTFPTYLDIEYHTKGKYVIESLERFNSEYLVMNKSNMNRFYYMSYIDIMTNAATVASYKGAQNLLMQYSEKYPSIEDFKNNMLKHLEIKRFYVVDKTENLLALFDKIIDDFSMVGIHITISEATKIISDVTDLDGFQWAITTLKGNNAVSVYLAEYVLINEIVHSNLE